MAGKSKARILIVDDQRAIRKLVYLTLENEGYELYQAETGDQAMKIVETKSPNIIILDVMMPGPLNGYQVCEKLKRDDRTKMIYVIIVTARGQKTDIEKGKQAGADDYLVKPFSPNELLAMVKKHSK